MQGFNINVPSTAMYPALNAPLENICHLLFLFCFLNYTTKKWGCLLECANLSIGVNYILNMKRKLDLGCRRSKVTPLEGVL